LLELLPARGGRGRGEGGVWRKPSLCPPTAERGVLRWGALCLPFLIAFGTLTRGG